MVVRALDEEMISGEAMYALADASGSLVSGANVACAGAHHLIVEILDVAMNGQYAKPLTSTEAQRILARIDDWDAFYRYILASSRLELLVKVHQALCTHALLSLVAHPNAMSDAERGLALQSQDRTYHRAGGALDDSTIVRSSVRIALALIEELDGSAVRTALGEAGLAGPDGDAFALQPIASDHLRQQAAQCIRRATQRLFPLCVADLDGVHAALGRFAGHTIATEDLLRRSGGPALGSLLEQLETS